jgi:hypothetical protein
VSLPFFHSYHSYSFSSFHSHLSSFVLPQLLNFILISLLSSSISLFHSYFPCFVFLDPFVLSLLPFSASSFVRSSILPLPAITLHQLPCTTPRLRSFHTPTSCPHPFISQVRGQSSRKPRLITANKNAQQGSSPASWLHVSQSVDRDLKKT